MESIFNWIAENYPWLAPTLVCCVIAWKISRWVRKIETSMEKVNKLPCNSHSETIRTHGNTIDRHTELLESNNKMLSAMSKWIMKLDPSMIDPISDAQIIYNMMSEKKSPRKLNQKGLEFYKELKGDKFLRTNKMVLYELIDSLKPKTAYDVELYALRALQIKSGEDFFNEYKLYVYNTPSIDITDAGGNKKKYDITLNDICFILSLPLRDMYLEEHPEIPR